MMAKIKKVCGFLSLFGRHLCKYRGYHAWGYFLFIHGCGHAITNGRCHTLDFFPHRFFSKYLFTLLSKVSAAMDRFKLCIYGHYILFIFLKGKNLLIIILHLL